MALQSGFSSRERLYRTLVGAHGLQCDRHTQHTLPNHSVAVMSSSGSSSGSESSEGSGSGPRAPTADELLQNLLDSVTSPSPAPAVTTVATPTPLLTPSATASDQIVQTTVDTPVPAANSSSSSAGLSIGLAVGAVVLVAVVVLLFRQRKRKRSAADRYGGHSAFENDLGTPQFSIELPRPPMLEASDRKRASEVRIPVLASVPHSGESVLNATGVRSPGNRMLNRPQTKLTNTAFRVDAPESSHASAFPRVGTGRSPAEFGSPGRLPVPSAAETSSSLPRDTTASASSINSLHDSTCGDFFTHGDGLGERIRALSRAKHHPSMVEEEDETAGRSQPCASMLTAAPQSYRGVTGSQRGAKPKSFAATPAMPVSMPAPQVVEFTPSVAARRAPPPPPVVVSAHHVYRPSTESDVIAFQRLSTVSTDSLGSLKRVSTASADSAAEARAGSMIEINKIVSGDGTQAAEIEI